MTTVLFGSIGTLADTSELQRAAFNEAFAAHGLDWEWSQAEYRELLADSGGERRIAAYAKSRGEQVDAAAVHRTKSEAFQRRLRTGEITPRPGVAETIARARDEGVRLALVTTTTPENVSALFEGLDGAVDPRSFELVLDLTDVSQAKPAPDVYRLALERLGESEDTCVAVEDNAGGVRAAAAAGVRVIAFPGENNAGHDFGEAAERVDALDLATLQAAA
jgi:HAD superfamily hydrolase (TIGR01509 family)